MLARRGVGNFDGTKASALCLFADTGSLERLEFCNPEPFLDLR